MIYTPRTTTLAIVSVLGIVLALGCRTAQPAPEVPQTRQIYSDPVLANTALGFELYNDITHPGPNLVYSPLSISTALAMTRAGALGETAQQISSTLHIVDDTDIIHSGYGALTRDLGERTSEDFTVSLANSLWVQMGLSYGIDFLQVLEREYRSEMRQVDFKTAPEASRELINTWVSERTQELIPNLLAPNTIRSNTRLVLVNALYFKGEWRHPFPKGATEGGPFHRADKSVVEVPMMQQESRLQYTATRHHDAVELPYANSDFSMVVVLPKQRSTNEFMGQTTPEALGELFDSLEWGTVALTMPKFNVRSTVALKDALTRMGMVLPFDENQADFSPITRNVQLFISHVAHEATITVDEIGTEAAAATAVIMIPTSEPPREKIVSINIDRPFVFFLRDRSTGAILFMGEIGDPS